MSLPVPKRKQGQSPAHARSRQQEKEAAEKIGGKTTKGSGSGWQKLDARGDIYRIECKTTARKSLRVTTEMIRKLEAGCFGSGKLPVIEVELELGEHVAYVIPKWAMEELFERLRDATS